MLRALPSTKLAITLRVLSSADAPQIERGFARLSLTSRQLRYGLPLADPRPALSWVDELGHGTHFAVGACTSASREPVGLARWAREADGGEVAVTVLDAWQGRGAGTLLLDALLRHAGDHGVGRLWASVMVENRRAVRLARRFGTQQRLSSTDGLLEYELTPAPNLSATLMHS